MSRYGTVHKGGRPLGAKAPHTIETEAAKKKVVEMVNAEIEAITRPQIEKAKKGDTKAYEVLTNRVHGKPAETVQLTGIKKLLVDF